MSGELDKNGKTIGSSGWLMINHGGQFSPGVHYSEDVHNFVFEDRFPQIQPDYTLWIMGPPKNAADPLHDPLPHARFVTGHYLLGISPGDSGSQINNGLGSYTFAPSLLSSWNGAGVSEIVVAPQGTAEADNDSNPNQSPDLGEGTTTHEPHGEFGGYAPPDFDDGESTSESEMESYEYELPDFDEGESTSESEMESHEYELPDFYEGETTSEPEA
jgi:hypothetical protein